MLEGVKRIYRKLMIIAGLNRYDVDDFLDTFLDPMIGSQPAVGGLFAKYAERKRTLRTTVAETISPGNVTLCPVLSKSGGRKCASINIKNSFAA